MNPISREPVLIQALATIVVWAATRYGLNVSDEQALQIAGGAFVVLAPFVRQLVRPVAKDPTLLPLLKAPEFDQFTAPLKSNVEVRDPDPSGRGGYPSGTTRVDEMPAPPPDPGNPSRGR